MTPLLEIRGLVKEFPLRRGLLQRRVGTVHALSGVDLDVQEGETVALVGESGSGKTTLGRCALRLLEPSAGSVRFRGEDLLALAPRELRHRRRHFQMVFQDPYSSLNPRMRIGEAIGEPMAVHGIAARRERGALVARLLEEVGLPPSAAGRFPHEFSGGQRQRIGIARALATGPLLLIADEPVSALDVSVRAQVLNLLVRLQGERRLALLFIAHDLALVEQIADRVAVLYLGELVEEGPAARLFATPQHPYTVALLSAVPIPDPERQRIRIVLPGDPPSPLAPPPGCRFHPRCPIARERCRLETPPLISISSGQRAACFYPGELLLGGGAPPAGETFSGRERNSGEKAQGPPVGGR